jgi:hypothetical protein
VKGSEFLATYAKASQAEWEAAALRAAQAGTDVLWPMIPVTVTSPTGHSATYGVTSDYFAVGDPSDYLRLPLTPLTAQRIADTKGFLLSTPKMVTDTWKASSITLTPHPMVPNKGPNLSQYAEHSQIIDSQLPPNAGLTDLISGHKKDVVLSNLIRPGKVVIFGWYQTNGTPIQPRTNVHGDFYADYSHGIRFVAPTMIVDGVQRNTADVLKDPVLSSLISDEGPLKIIRYPVSPSSSSAIAALDSNFDIGTNVIIVLGMASMSA